MYVTLGGLISNIMNVTLSGVMLGSKTKNSINNSAYLIMLGTLISYLREQHTPNLTDRIAVLKLYT